ncbi:hypothetical protein PFLA_a2147 [Pseudoalteromonas flavipulchra NCIMB 2033 = ATCC BAA-314]|nr:hypothetical protein [Pseudoalteromonas flavipulchra NCIMB 2033 = ATCC BAA-314]
MILRTIESKSYISKASLTNESAANMDILHLGETLLVLFKL